MGELYLHDLKYYIEKFNCKQFVETGSGKGTGLNHALKYDFNKLYSIEIIEDLHNYCTANFKDPRLELICNNSIDGLQNVLSRLDNTPCLFWLDAHFPGADFHYNSYDHLSDVPELHKPLKKEIELIKHSRPFSQDVFIIDDLQIYEDGPFELLNKDFKNKYGESNINFVKELYEDTHNFTRDYRHQGFLILTPKKA